ncbi:polysaccharide deacetylase family protein [Pseudoxanthomonas dokdonensis]|uniref:polysaccharide deacetylase family protein n=1 Tax=Pseudoxanthomonas dokdonensis TaxID=344882 RepID=UPI0014769A10|nr:polysaccharide deacetylase family protein [Pseudoxanthomonas dokdonensis]
MPGTRPRRVRAGVALMYHALANGGQVPAGQDPVYTLPLQRFEQQLDHLRADGGGGSAIDWLAGRNDARTLLSFDDGHLSNYTLAFPALVSRGMTADFFVNPVMVGKPGFADWSQLREMADAGMSIQSHGHDHVYFTGMSRQQLRASLVDSRQAISQRIGQPVTLLAPPGGRMPRGLLALARECGYAHVFSSRPGLVGDPGNGARIFPRLAMTQAVGMDGFVHWVKADASSLRREQLRYGGLALAKRLLGDQHYERLRGRLIATLRGTS